jgi:hypothetical protein
MAAPIGGIENNFIEQLTMINKKINNMEFWHNICFCFGYLIDVTIGDGHEHKTNLGRNR